MENLSQKEFRFVIEALQRRKEQLRAKLDQGDLDEDAAGGVGEDLMLCESLITFFEGEKDEEFERSKEEVAKTFDLEAVRAEIDKG